MIQEDNKKFSSFEIVAKSPNVSQNNSETSLQFSWSRTIIASEDSQEQMILKLETSHLLINHPSRCICCKGVQSIWAERWNH